MSDKTFTPGRFVWHELLTTDVESAKGFYGELFGWTFKGMPMPDGSTYWIAEAGEVGVGGMMKKPEEVPAPAFWSAYVSVDDVDATVARALAAGGQSPMPTMDLEGVGRMGVVIDPGGAVSWAFRSAQGDTPRTERPKVGEFCWESLASNDIARATEFYGEVYRWKASSFNGMTVFGVGEGMENQVADVMPAPPGAPAYWGSHVVVASLDDARGRVKRLGGAIVVEEIVVPTIGKIAVAADRQGATICLFQPEM